MARSRSFSPPYDPARVLEPLRTCREAMVTPQTKHHPRSTIYREAIHLQRNIDDLALLLTGKQDYFLPPGHSTP